MHTCKHKHIVKVCEEGEVDKHTMKENGVCVAFSQLFDTFFLFPFFLLLITPES